ncbi:hypothetical protein [Dietzia sp.]|uniref:hypothetical protein n=1 Tax=Dietzia sp. TaxID=1871616 RepID=UPI002FDB554F
MAIKGFGPRYRSPRGEEDAADGGENSRYDRSARRGRPGKTPMDLGTKSVVYGIGALLISWIPVLNIIGLVAALITIAFSLFVRVPNTAVDIEPNMRRANIGLALGIAAIIVFGVSTAITLHLNPA